MYVTLFLVRTNLENITCSGLIITSVRSWLMKNYLDKENDIKFYPDKDNSTGSCLGG